MTNEVLILQEISLVNNIPIFLTISWSTEWSNSMKYVAKSVFCGKSIAYVEIICLSVLRRISIQKVLL